MSNVVQKLRIRSARKVHEMAMAVASDRTQMVGKRAAITEHISTALNYGLGALAYSWYGWNAVLALAVIRALLAMRAYRTWTIARKDAA